MASLWGEAFSVPTKEKTKKLVKKVETKIQPETQVVVKRTVKSKKISNFEKLELITSEVHRILGVYENNTVVLDSEDAVRKYFDVALTNGKIAIDTETDHSLDPLTCKLMGVCVYTPNAKQAYIPVSHTDLSGNLLSNQVSVDFLYDQLTRLNDIYTIFHNGKFDFEVIKCTTGVELRVDWDTMIGARVLNETERAGLKEQYIQKIDPSIEKYSIEHLFSDIPYEIVDPKIFALYAATDSYMTYRLYEYQLEEFNKPENAGLFNLFKTVEMPVLPALASMELTGMCVDTEYAHRLSLKYHKKLDELDAKIDAELDKYTQAIIDFKNSSEAQSIKSGSKSLAEQIQLPVNLASATQLAILLYDVLKIKPVSTKAPRGTGEDVLLKLQEKNPDFILAKLILERRTLVKLLNTYIDKLIECISPVDGRLHARFNQIGADTGRLSSSDPNLQNIPSKNNEIRMMFVAAPGKTFCGGDYSQQEPRLLSSYSSDEKMINSYKEGKDLYAVIASNIYHNKYEDNKEFYPDGTMNPEGKHRRTSCKSILLGLMYGRGINSVAEQIKPHKGPTTQEDIKEAQRVTRAFFDSFPNVEKWMNETQEFAKREGYVEDLWGRRRRLPDIQLDKYEVKYKGTETEFNPLLYSSGINPDSDKLTAYRKKLSSIFSKKEYEELKVQAARDSVEIKDNSGFIATAERQAVNARIQGGAASMSKRAMIAVHNDSLLRDLGFKLVNAVHDELIGEVPEENGKAACNRLTELMIEAAKPQCKTPMKCDTDCYHAWYEDVYEAETKEYYEDLIKEGKSPEEAFNQICNEKSECTEDQLRGFLKLI